jgi:hypothetical protein
LAVARTNPNWPFLAGQSTIDLSSKNLNVDRSESDINCGAAGKKKLITDRQRVLKGAPADQFAG